MGGSLTTIVARVCLNLLQSRRSKREEPLDVRVPDPVVSPPDGTDPEHEALLADSVGLALLVVLETLEPRRAAGLRAPRRIRRAIRRYRSHRRAVSDACKAAGQPRPAPDTGSHSCPRPDLNRQREVVDAFLAAARTGDFEGLLAVLDPDVVLRADAGAVLPGLSRVVRGAAAVAGQAVTFSGPTWFTRPVLVNGAPGFVVFARGEPFAVGGFTVKDGKIVEMDILADPERLRKLDLSFLDQE